MDVSAAILAGGQSRRMGRRNKAHLEIEGETFLARAIGRLRPLFRHLMIIGHDIAGYEPYGLPVHTDLRPGNGSLGGIHTALCYSPTSKIFCVACDMPFLDPAVVSYLLSLDSEDWDIVIPSLPDGPEPLCAIYSSRLETSVSELLNRGERRARSLLEGRHIRFVSAEELRAVDPHLESFMNVNTPGDLERALRKVGGSLS